ncbi:Similar to NOF: 120.7 kDa protein in NOF-FB transposable element (Drosophila melanogaster) [Cotesia congregata]|uniref:Similar to NOF: 120.7 kDa protein in NOF-FB transposable element (Drosophila melanogaster) n=2 Tax=Endopterygota TaxID=33392 RepID=A0A8J2EB38_COTCN|nr:Similar to NOF: 120.7 kDa protein in NOF-FB transposable element (Drosophila melanogaster) [Cotesia congregata]
MQLAMGLNAYHEFVNFSFADKSSLSKVLTDVSASVKTVAVEHAVDIIKQIRDADTLDMPRKARVSVNDAVEVIKEFIIAGNFKDNNFPIKSSEIWIQMSLRFDNKWSARDVYREVREDRRKILTKAREQVGVPVINTNSSSMLFEEDILSDMESENLSDSGDSDWEAPGLETVLLSISEELFKILHEREPVCYKKRNYTILERFKWTGILAEKIYLLTHMPCSFAFKNCKIYPDEGSVHYLTIRGKCQSKVCGNKIFCFLDKKPSNFPCDLRIRTKDTFAQPHEDIRRPTRKFERLKIGEQALNEGVGNYTKRQAALHAQTNKRLPPILPKQNIVRQCKNEFIHYKLGVKPEDGRDVRDKFYVIYSTRNQLVSYKRYCRLNKISRVAIDGTGSIIQPITYLNGEKSGHIFLYAIVINFNKKSHSVHQLLTECQSTQTLICWLKSWLYMGAPKPTEACCDSSRALINALSFAFNDLSIKTYIDTLYLRAIGDTSHISRPSISTFIRLDVAHFVHMISEWKCLKNQKNSLVKKFYLYGVALMIDSQNVEEFEKIFRLICIVTMNERDDSIMKSTGQTVAQARHQLKIFIATRDLSLIVNKLESKEIDETKINNDPDKEEDQKWSENSSEPSPVKTFINNIYKSAKDIKTLGKAANAYYAEDFMKEFLAKAYEFPLWTSACFPNQVEHATTSYVEQFFGNKKERSLIKWNSLVRADVFLKHEYQEYTGKKNYDSSDNLKQNNINQIFNNDKLVDNTSIIINDSDKNIPFTSTPEKNFDIDLNIQINSLENSEHLKNDSNDLKNSDGLYQNESSDSLKDVEKSVTDCNFTLSNMSDGILLSSIDFEDGTNDKLPSTAIDENNRKIIKDISKNEEKILDDSDLIAVDNWRNKGRQSRYDYHNSLNSSDEENDKSAVKVFEKKIIASPKKLAVYNSSDEESDLSAVFEKKITASPKKLTVINSSNEENDISAVKVFEKKIIASPKKLELLPQKNILNKLCKANATESNRKHLGFHFLQTPDILDQTITPENTNKTSTFDTKKKKKLGILQNGNKRNPISLKGINVLLFNTCAIDSIIHVLAVTGKDDPQFLKYMKENSNQTMKFICEFIDKGPVTSVYKSRTVLLSQLFKDRIVEKNKESVLYANEIDMWSSIFDIWTRCFPNSACFNHDCRICGLHKVPVPMVQVNHKILWEGGYSKLEESISTFDSKIRCTKCKLTMINRSLLFNRCICIELNVQKLKSGPLTCKLRDMPAIIQLNNFNYRLRGIIECEAGHFKSYCRRGQNYWSLYDDKATTATKVLSSKDVKPDAVIFTRIL